jgi:hypothetical protein
VSAGGRLVAPACATYAEALAGRYPAAMLARGSRRALALVTQSVAAALVGAPVVASPAALPARERLDATLARLSRALADRGDARPNAIASSMTPRIRAYANVLGIDHCG